LQYEVDRQQLRDLWWVLQSRGLQSLRRQKSRPRRRRRRPPEGRPGKGERESSGEAGAIARAVQMVLVGEESGKLDAMLLELAQVYEAEVEADVKRALTLLEPALILGMGGLIAIIIMGILMGILSVNTMAF